jgi:27-O-demethylrifamycin SV methyltransferase
MAEAAEIRRDDEVLDVGCGTGSPACHLAGQLGARVTGISTSEVGIAAATARATSLGLSDRTRFELRDATDNGLPNAAFDRVWVLESSHLMRDRERLIAECSRVLKPGGRLALCDIVARRELPLSEVVRLVQPFTLLRDVFGDAKMELLARYAERAARHGLVVDRLDDLTASTRPTFERWRANARRHREETIQTLGEDGVRHFLEACDVLERFWDDHTLGYGLIAARKGT